MAGESKNERQRADAPDQTYAVLKPFVYLILACAGLYAASELRTWQEERNNNPESHQQVKKPVPVWKAKYIFPPRKNWERRKERSDVTVLAYNFGKDNKFYLKLKTWRGIVTFDGERTSESSISTLTGPGFSCKTKVSGEEGFGRAFFQLEDDNNIVGGSWGKPQEAAAKGGVIIPDDTIVLWREQ